MLPHLSANIKKRRRTLTLAPLLFLIELLFTCFQLFSDGLPQLFTCRWRAVDAYH